jgi:hypothetical protein
MSPRSEVACVLHWKGCRFCRWSRHLCSVHIFNKPYSTWNGILDFDSFIILDYESFR